MADKPKRRWFQFRLRTLLVGVVLISVPLAYVAHEARIVAERKAWVAAHPTRAFLTTVKKGDRRQIPLIRHLLGDEQQSMVVVVTEDQIQMAQSLFPEADIAFVNLGLNFDIPANLPRDPPASPESTHK